MIESREEKKREKGTVPVGWREDILSTLVDIIGGGTPKTSVPEYWNGHIPWLSVKDFNNEQRIVYTTEKTITQLGLEKSSTTLLQKDDIIISARGTVGELAMIPYPMAFNQSCYGLRAHDNIDKIFLYYLLKFNIDIIKYNVHGSVFDTITRSTFDGITVLIPPLETQQKIASILSDLDDKIELNNKINKNLEEQAQALFKSWFVDFEPFGGVMPEGWKRGKLSEIATVTMGQSPSGISYNEDAIGTLFFQGRAEFNFRFPSMRLFTTEPKRIAKQYDILMSVRAPVGDINVAYADCCIGRGLSAIRSLDNCQSFMLYTMFSLKERLNIFNGEGTIFGSITRDSLNDIEVTIPALAIKKKFEYIVAPMDAAIFNNSQENTRLAALRDTLLPKLLSGEVEC
ncbi:MAG: restriction endonuclease subunit S [Desulfovibrionaceae bacterium]|nr:restriction endonuclease subunit S [Desulfovibrionaceae bacterium]